MKRSIKRSSGDSLFRRGPFEVSDGVHAATPSKWQARHTKTLPRKIIIPRERTEQPVGHLPAKERIYWNALEPKEEAQS